MTGKALQQALIEAVASELADLDIPLTDLDMADIETSVTNVLKGAWAEATEEEEVMPDA